MNHTDKDTLNLMQRIDNQPGLREKIEKIVSIAEAASGTPDDINDIEDLILQETRQLQKSALQSWANNKHEALSEAVHRSGDHRQSGKKK